MKHFTYLIPLISIGFLTQAFAKDNKFDGKWVYEQTCGPQQVASIELTQKKNQVDGKWSNGSTRGSGVSGKLKGNIKSGKLFVNYCGDDENSDHPICPDYESESSDYFVRQGKDLIWYKLTIGKNGREFEKYLLLHPTVNGKVVIKDGKCTS
ncbi:hypothetical protein [Xanthomonas albilineans]|uniref:hypothetical protein n=1 Tax=Xanthomonas albilineans TaxID=29447 RepID=UPI000B1D1932|nr:hypothetical protein [Xanthomonas albilineans]